MKHLSRLLLGMLISAFFVLIIIGVILLIAYAPVVAIGGGFLFLVYSIGSLAEELAKTPEDTEKEIQEMIIKNRENSK